MSTTAQFQPVAVSLARIAGDCRRVPLSVANGVQPRTATGDQSASTRSRRGGTDAPRASGTPGPPAFDRQMGGQPCDAHAAVAASAQQRSIRQDSGKMRHGSESFCRAADALSSKQLPRHRWRGWCRGTLFHFSTTPFVKQFWDMVAPMRCTMMARVLSEVSENDGVMVALRWRRFCVKCASPAAPKLVSSA